MNKDKELRQLQEEVESLRVSAAAQEAHLVAVTEEMDAMLRDVERQRNELAEAHARLASGAGLLDRIIDTADDLIVFAGANGRILRFNRQQVERLALEPSGLLGASLDILIADEDLQTLATRLPPNAIKTRGVLFEVVRAQGRFSSELRLKVGAGKTAAIWQLRAGVVLTPQGKFDGVVAIFTDITAWREAEADMRLAASVCQNIAEAIMVTDVHGDILSVNPAFTHMTGFTSEEVVGKNPRLLKSDHHDKDFYAGMWRSIIENGSWEGDVWNRRKNGELYLQRGTIRMIPDDSGRPIRYVYVFQDYTDAWHRDEHTRHLAFHDPLTGLANRMLLESRLGQVIVRAPQENLQPVLLFIDLDGFKQVNDNLGHDVGDDLLKVVAERLLRLVRTVDTVSRLGGDEFVVLLEETRLDRDDIAQIAARVVDSIRQPIHLAGQVIGVGASVGLAIYPGDGDNEDALMKNADLAMYAAKSAGKNTYRFFSPN